MYNAESPSFVPVLTVMVDYGNAPFLWRVNSPDERGVGGNLCDGTCWDESFPMSEGLWQKFADWAIEFDRTQFYSDNFDADDWDWIAFHARGLQLAHWLKDEVGDTYRIIYVKPYEDPNHHIDERTEILADGVMVPLPSHRRPFPGPLHFCRHIISGGQAGADRAALDFAIKYGYTHGGWAPHGRKAEDGVIPLKYQLAELPEGGYRQRTRRNVEDSDGTLIVNLGELDGGTLATQTFAQQLDKPHLVVQLDSGVSKEIENSVVAWLSQNAIKTLNVAGPRESKRPGIYQATLAFLERLAGVPLPMNACMPKALTNGQGVLSAINGEYEENLDGKAAGRTTASPTLVAASLTRDDNGAGFRQRLGEWNHESNGYDRRSVKAQGPPVTPGDRKALLPSVSQNPGPW